jgi:hypothetical protein
VVTDDVTNSDQDDPVNTGPPHVSPTAEFTLRSSGQYRLFATIVLGGGAAIAAWSILTEVVNRQSPILTLVILASLLGGLAMAHRGVGIEADETRVWATFFGRPSGGSAARSDIAAIDVDRDPLMKNLIFERQDGSAAFTAPGIFYSAADLRRFAMFLGIPFGPDQSKRGGR